MFENSVTNERQSGNSTEEKIKAIWQEVLEMSDIAPNVPFLDLGGDSLSAMLCMAKMRALLQVEFTIEDFFMEDSTVSGFSKVIDDQT